MQQDTSAVWMTTAFFRQSYETDKSIKGTDLNNELERNGITLNRKFGPNYQTKLGGKTKQKKKAEEQGKPKCHLSNEDRKPEEK